jgi:hypothetical protein
MTDTFRALCAELLQGLDENRHPEVRYPGHLRLVMARARAALAEGDGVGPADAEVAELVVVLRADAECVSAEQPDLMQITDAQLSRAADLLEQGTTHPRPAPMATQELRDAFKNVLREARRYGFNSAEFDGNVADWLTNAMGERSFFSTPAVDLAAVLAPGYSLGLGAQEGAQLVDGHWWLPAIGCDSLQAVVDNCRGATHPRPIPVAERPLLKRDSFSDKLGRCWCGTAACVDQTGDFDIHMPASWELREPCPEDDCLLPAAAIPLPQQETTNDR